MIDKVDDLNQIIETINNNDNPPSDNVRDIIPNVKIGLSEPFHNSSTNVVHEAYCENVSKYDSKDVDNNDGNGEGSQEDNVDVIYDVNNNEEENLGFGNNVNKNISEEISKNVSVDNR